MFRAFFFLMCLLIACPARAEEPSPPATAAPPAPAAAPVTNVEIPLNPMMELNNRKKQDIYDIRRMYAEKYPQFMGSNYKPSDDVFGQIEDDRPWWGILGRSYYGAGENSIQGPAEASRFIANPLLLVGLDTGHAVVVQKAGLKPRPVYPEPLHLYWQADGALAMAEYDITTFKKDSADIGDGVCVSGHMMLVAYNARDLGYNFLYVDPAKSKYFAAKPHIVKIAQFLHKGDSCGYAGGCNNVAPVQPELNIVVTGLPATAYIKLWKAQPNSFSDPADMVFVLKMI
ncbi:MAG: hypothetical protein EPN97_11105 [Alphaproteobacteria bacterium]|nr:MAG: hypothetical protein EPN97_11105 [Alphaproteobacteria bacterium]